jgi:simple sugar transport system ATP-binding protein
MSLELKGITKRFPGVLANDNVNISVETGEILALLGENGAGKTTLMNILYGLYTPDEGEVFVDGKPLQLSSPADSIAAGIGMVHQHFMLVPVFTVTENVILGMEPANSIGWLDQQTGSQIVEDISGRYNLEVDPDAFIEDLPVGVQQRVEIIKVLSREARYVIFDEPTSVLTPQEVEEFFRIVKGLREDGKGIIFISHKLDEALEIADRINIIRDGKIVEEVLPEQTSKEECAFFMVGRPVELIVQKEMAEAKDKVLEVKDLVALDERDHRAVDGVSFEVRAGEIVGIAGVQGNGQTELIESIMGLLTPLAGSILIEGKDVTNASPRELHSLGFAHNPEDRQES